MKTVAKRFAAGDPDPRWDDAIGNHVVGDDLKTVAGVFVALQQARHRADYDMGWTVTRNEALGYIEQAEDAFAAMRRVRGTEASDVFLLALLLQRAVNA